VVVGGVNILIRLLILPLRFSITRTLDYIFFVCVCLFHRVSTTACCVISHEDGGWKSGCHAWVRSWLEHVLLLYWRIVGAGVCCMYEAMSGAQGQGRWDGHAGEVVASSNVAFLRMIERRV
jgi:hypothetical protein